MLRKNVKCLEFCPVTMFRSKASVSAHWPVRAQALITVFMATVSGGNVLPCHAAKNARLKGPCWPIWCRNATTIYESMRLLLVAYDLWLYSHDDLMITSDCSWFSRYCSCGHFWWFLYDLWCFFSGDDHQGAAKFRRSKPTSDSENNSSGKALDLTKHDKSITSMFSMYIYIYMCVCVRVCNLNRYTTIYIYNLNRLYNIYIYMCVCIIQYYVMFIYLLYHLNVWPARSWPDVWHAAIATWCCAARSYSCSDPLRSSKFRGSHGKAMRKTWFNDV